MNDGVVFSREGRFERRCVADVGFDQSPTRMTPVRADVSFFEKALVKAVEIVEDGHLVTIEEKRIHDMAADESGSSGEEDAHALSVDRQQIGGEGSALQLNTREFLCRAQDAIMSRRGQTFFPASKGSF